MSGIALQATRNGVQVDQFGNTLAGRLVYVYERDTTDQIQVYADEVLTVPYASQPLTVQSDGTVPGYVSGSVPFDYVDAATGVRKQGLAEVSGPPGPTGPTGPVGSPGSPAGTQRGSYSSVTTYAANDVVLGSNAQWYVSLGAANLNHDPTTDGGVHWAPQIPSLFTAAADASTPLTLVAHSATQSAALLAVTDSSANALFTVGPKGVLTLNPARTDGNGLTLNMPTGLDGVNGTAGLLISDTGTTHGARCLRINHSGSGLDAGGNASYGLEIRNISGTSGQAIATHNYAANIGSSLIMDETKNNTLILLRNAQNGTQAAGDHGTGAYFDLRGYWLTSASANYFTATDGVVAGTNLQSSSATFVAEDAGNVGKQIVVAGTKLTIAAFVDANNVTLSSAPGDGSGITFSYAKLPDQMLTFSSTLAWTNFSSQPMLFTNSAGQAEVMKLTQLAAATLPTLSIVNPSTGAGINVNQTGVANGINVTQSAASHCYSAVQSGGAGAVLVTMNSGATGFYGIVVNGYTHGIQATNSQNSGFALQVTKSGTGAGVAAGIINKGTGDTMQWFIGSAGTTQAMKLTGLGSLVIGQGGALATSATDGFVYLPSCAGAPSGVPTTQTGSVAAVYDTTNNKLYVYNGGWKSVTLA